MVPALLPQYDFIAQLPRTPLPPPAAEAALVERMTALMPNLADVGDAVYDELALASELISRGLVLPALERLRGVGGALCQLDERALRSKPIMRHIASVLLNGCNEMTKLWARVAVAHLPRDEALAPLLTAFDLCGALRTFAGRIGVAETCVTACASLVAAIIVALGDRRTPSATADMYKSAVAVTTHLSRIVTAKHVLAAVAATMPSRDASRRAAASGNMHTRLTADGVVDADATQHADFFVGGESLNPVALPPSKRRRSQSTDDQAGDEDDSPDDEDVWRRTTHDDLMQSFTASNGFVHKDVDVLPDLSSWLN
jgi:hypothetical protein